MHKSKLSFMHIAFIPDFLKYGSLPQHHIKVLILDSSYLKL
ncbi:hypothetical protein L293_1107 [Acinetobacter gyllenbergii CIP 110306 = MTCC 11365]|nr:hypothetical protein L293_1107 [Acinetobacter gyllenbergii CIP 110306 = MTCC 11365]